MEVTKPVELGMEIGPEDYIAENGAVVATKESSTASRERLKGLKEPLTSQKRNVPLILNG